MKLTLLGALFKENIADTIDNENLAVLGLSALLSTDRATASKLSLDGSADTRVLCLFNNGSSLRLRLLGSTFAFTLSSTLLLSVPVHGLRLFFGLRLDDRGRGTVSNVGDALDIITPGSTAGMTDVAVDEIAVLDVVHVEDDVVDTTTDEDEETEHDGGETRAEPLVVVAGTAPFREAVAEEVIVALAFRTTKNVGHYAEAGKASRGFLAKSIDLLLCRLLVLVDVDGGLFTLLGLLDRRCGIVGSDEALTGLVRVQDTSLLLVGGIDVFDACEGLYSKEGVECNVAAFVLGDFVLKTENFMVCQLSVT